ncbi:sensor histidine kinase [Aliidiomarina celeris]|uniref:sensor histidine kinase n=1 Tax=Aliidiomarina celeris TaxID=2249428 RepID=UPI001300696E|nr:GHKL domain-containing protein [Aliidiomarina celeris]
MSFGAIDNVAARANQFLRLLFLITIAVSLSMTVRAFLISPVPSLLSEALISWALLTVVSVALTWLSYALRRTQTTYHLSGQLLLLIALWGAAVYLLGGAMSSTNAIQLILVALLFLVLPLSHALALLLFMVAIQVVYVLQLIAMHSQHDQHQHFVGMSVSFLIAAVILAAVTYSLRQALERNEKKMAELREEQMRQEQVLAVATASAQMSHELATPLGTLKLWLDELDETENHDLEPIRHPIERMTTLLAELQQTARNIQANEKTSKTIQQLESELKHLIILQYPEHPVQWTLTCSQRIIMVDETLSSALLNLIRNAIQHQQTTQNLTQAVDVESSVTENLWQLRIRNAFHGDPSTLATLGLHIQSSQHGLGIGTLLSHATLERFHGHLSLSTKDGFVEQRVEIPLAAGA